MTKSETVNVRVPPEWRAHLRALATRSCRHLGEAVRDSDVVRELLREGLDRHPVSAQEIEEAQALPSKRRDTRSAAARLTVKLAGDSLLHGSPQQTDARQSDPDTNDSTDESMSPRGFDLGVRGSHHAA